MSLTVASAALDFAWTEFGAVEYTAGTLNTLSACIDHVGGKLNRNTPLSASTVPTDTQVSEWLIRAKEELQEARQFTWGKRYVTATLTVGTYRYALPPDFSGDASFRDMTDDRKIGLVSPHQFDVLFPDVTESDNGTILVGCIRGREVWFGPSPDSANVIELHYQRSGEDITATDFSWLPELSRFMICDFAIAEAFEALHQWGEADRFRMKWEISLKKTSIADGRKKWSEMGFRARSVFQA